MASWLSSLNKKLNEDRFILRSDASLLYAKQIFITIPLTGDEGCGYKGNFSFAIEKQFSEINRYHLSAEGVPANFLIEKLPEHSEFSNFL